MIILKFMLSRSVPSRVTTSLSAASALSSIIMLLSSGVISTVRVFYFRNVIVNENNCQVEHCFVLSQNVLLCQ